MKIAKDMVLPFLMVKMNELELKFSQKIEELNATIESQREEISQIKGEKTCKN